MNYHEWLDKGFAFTSRAKQIAKEITCPVDIVCPGKLCSDGLDKKVTIKALWDTGATISSIDRDLAQSLSLIPIGKLPVFHADGRSIQDVYTVNVNLLSRKFVINVGKAVSGSFSGQDFKMLIGMDIISLGDFFFGRCMGSEGYEVSYFSFAIPSIDRKIDFVKEWQDGRVRRDKGQQIIRNQPKRKPPRSKR